MKGCGHVYASTLARSEVRDSLCSRVKSAKTGTELEHTLIQRRRDTLERFKGETLSVVKNYVRPANSTSFPDYLPNTQA